MAVRFYSSESGVGGGNPLSFRIGKRVMKGEDISRYFLFKKVFCELFKSCILRKNMFPEPA